MSEVEKALLYLVIGMSLFAFMAVDDYRHGRKIQRRDYHLLAFWPVILLVVFVLGLFEFSRLTSVEDGKALGRPTNWL